MKDDFIGSSSSDIKESVMSKLRGSVLFSNSNLEEAEVIAIGDSHNNLISQIRVRQELEHLLRPGDVVLIEGIGFEEHVRRYFDPKIEGLINREDILFEGWEEKSLYDKFADQLRRIEYIQSMRSNPDISFEEKGRLYMELREIDTEKFRTEIIANRNRVLEARIKLHRGQGKRVIVLAGELHLTEALFRQSLGHYKHHAITTFNSSEESMPVFNSNDISKIENSEPLTFSRMKSPFVQKRYEFLDPSEEGILNPHLKLGKLKQILLKKFDGSSEM